MHCEVAGKIFWNSSCDSEDGAFLIRSWVRKGNQWLHATPKYTQSQAVPSCIDVLQIFSSAHEIHRPTAVFEIFKEQQKEMGLTECRSQQVHHKQQETTLKSKLWLRTITERKASAHWMCQDGQWLGVLEPRAAMSVVILSLATVAMVAEAKDSQANSVTAVWAPYELPSQHSWKGARHHPFLMMHYAASGDSDEVCEICVRWNL